MDYISYKSQRVVGAPKGRAAQVEVSEVSELVRVFTNAIAARS